MNVYIPPHLPQSLVLVVEEWIRRPTGDLVWPAGVPRIADFLDAVADRLDQAQREAGPGIAQARIRMELATLRVEAERARGGVTAEQGGAAGGAVLAVLGLLALLVLR